MIAGKFGELGEHVEENLKDCMEEVAFDDRLRYPLCAGSSSSGGFLGGGFLGSPVGLPSRALFGIHLLCCEHGLYQLDEDPDCPIALPNFPSLSQCQ